MLFQIRSKLEIGGQKIKFKTYYNKPYWNYNKNVLFINYFRLLSHIIPFC